MRAAFDNGVGVLNLIHPLLENPDWSTRRTRIKPLLRKIVNRCKQEGSTRSDLRVDDIVVPVIRFSRPLAMGLSRAQERALARRHLEIYIAGLAAS
jgi:hypothetical protein